MQLLSSALEGCREGCHGMKPRKQPEDVGGPVLREQKPLLRAEEEGVAARGPARIFSKLRIVARYTHHVVSSPAFIAADTRTSPPPPLRHRPVRTPSASPLRDEQRLLAATHCSSARHVLRIALVVLHAAPCDDVLVKAGQRDAHPRCRRRSLWSPSTIRRDPPSALRGCGRAAIHTSAPMSRTRRRRFQEAATIAEKAACIRSRRSQLRSGAA